MSLDRYFFCTSRLNAVAIFSFSASLTAPVAVNDTVTALDTSGNEVCSSSVAGPAVDASSALSQPGHSVLGLAAHHASTVVHSLHARHDAVIAMQHIGSHACCSGGGGDGDGGASGGGRSGGGGVGEAEGGGVGEAEGGGGAGEADGGTAPGAYGGGGGDAGGGGDGSGGDGEADGGGGAGEADGGGGDGGDGSGGVGGGGVGGGGVGEADGGCGQKRSAPGELHLAPSHSQSL